MADGSDVLGESAKGSSQADPFPVPAVPRFPVPVPPFHKPGLTLGATDDYGYNVTEDPVHVHDVQATILHCLGIDHTRLTFKFQGRHFRLTDVHGNVVKSVTSS